MLAGGLVPTIVRNLPLVHDVDEVANRAHAYGGGAVEAVAGARSGRHPRSYRTRRQLGAGMDWIDLLLSLAGGGLVGSFAGLGLLELPSGTHRSERR